MGLDFDKLGPMEQLQAVGGRTIRAGGRTIRALDCSSLLPL